MSTIDDLLQNIETIFKHDVNRNYFLKHIDYIRFPFYKNYEENLKVSFDFPLTFLTGTNGTGKSSLLHALYGTPNGQSIGDYWFNTVLDPIENIGDNRHCFIYSFRTEFTKQSVEVLKTRIQKKDKNGKIDFDYWEPSRPIKKYGMTFNPQVSDERELSETRWKLQDRKVYYMDFRYSLSAFDKYFYFSGKSKPNQKESKQDVIRKHARRLKVVFDNDSSETWHTRQISKPIKFSDEAIKEICYILDKNYKEAKILEHNLYDKDKGLGFAIRYKTNDLSYSEAFAGSGEIAVAKLVNDLLDVEDHSLVLLDEPETSLHPAAQRKLIHFILRQIKHKKLQVVVSTHSPDILDNMPPEAIKLLYENPNSHKISVINKVFPENAFIHLGHSISEKRLIVVEDNLAKQIVETVLMKTEDMELFEIIFSPGGESRIKQENMLVYSKTRDRSRFIIFDGDQRRNGFDLGILQANQKNVRGLSEIIKTLVGQEIIFSFNSNSTEEEKTTEMLKYIEYFNSNVFFLPQMIPEDIIWSRDIAERIITCKETLDLIDREQNIKRKFNLIAKSMYDDTTSVGQNSVYKYFLTQWIKSPDENYSVIIDIIEKIKRCN